MITTLIKRIFCLHHWALQRDLGWVQLFFCEFCGKQKIITQTVTLK